VVSGAVGGTTRIAGGWSAITAVTVDRYALAEVEAGGLPQVVGAEGGLTPVGSLAWAHDGRDAPAEPWVGHYAQVGVDGGVGPYRFGRVTADLRGYGRWTDWHTYALRARLQQAFGSQTPFWYLPEFGGMEVGRGFVTDRYLGRVALTGQAETRHRLYKALHAAAFVDLGWVTAGWRDLDPAAVRPAVGFGPQVRINSQAILCWDLGFGLGPDGVESFSVGFHEGPTF
jgi:hypothetical protein